MTEDAQVSEGTAKRTRISNVDFCRIAKSVRKDGGNVARVAVETGLALNTVRTKMTEMRKLAEAQGLPRDYFVPDYPKGGGGRTPQSDEQKAAATKALIDAFAPEADAQGDS